MTSNDLNHAATVLAKFGYKASTRGDELHVWLPLFSSIVVRHSEGTYTMTPRFGFVNRTPATWISFALAFTLPWAILSEVDGNAGLDAWRVVAAIVLPILAVIWEVLRYIATEGMMTRLQMLLLDNEAT